MSQLGRGKTSVVSELTRAVAFEKDMGDALPSGVKNMASINRAHKNAFRDISRKLGHWRGFELDLQYIDLPIRSKNNKLMWVQWPVIPPHHLAAAIWHASPQHFEAVFSCGTPGSYIDVWSAMAQTDWGRELPQVRDHFSWPWRIAFRLHGDAFRCFKQQKIMGLQWKASTSMGNPWLTRLLFTLIPVELMIKATRGRNAQFNTLWHALRYFSWFMNVLYGGTGPLELPPGVNIRGRSRSCTEPRA